jgi:hypothetical protein
MDDELVTSVPAQHVLKQQAYILFYSKVQAVRSIPEKKVAVAGPSHVAPSVKSVTVTGTVSSSVSVSVPGEKRVGVNGLSHVAPSVKAVSVSSTVSSSVSVSVPGEKRVGVSGPSHAAPSVKSVTVTGTVSSSVSVSGEKRVGVNGLSHAAPSVKSVTVTGTVSSAVSVSGEKRVGVNGLSHAAPSVKSVTVSGTVSSSVSVSGEKRVAVAAPSHAAPSVKSVSVSSSSACPVSSGISPSRTSSDSFFSSSKKTVIQQPVSRSSQHVVAVAGSRADPPHARPFVPLQHSSERRVITIKSPVVNGFATLSSVTQINVSCSKASNSNVLKSLTGDCKGAPSHSTVPQMKKQKHQPCSVLNGDSSAEGSEFDHRSRISNESSCSTASTTASSSSAEKMSSNGTHFDDMRKRKREVRLKTIGSDTRRSRYLSPPFRCVRNIPHTAYAVP